MSLLNSFVLEKYGPLKYFAVGGEAKEMNFSSHFLSLA